MDTSKTGARIKERRKELGLKQEELAEKLLGISTARGGQTISEYENGKHIPPLSKIQRLAEILECDADYLLGSIEHPDITTSWIAEQIPLTRDAIESLMGMKYRLDEWSDPESILVGYNILSDIIIHIEESLNRALIDETGKIIEYDDFISNVGDLLSAYESIAEYESLKGTPFEMDKSHRNEQLTIRGVSSWLGSDLAEVIRKSVKEYADPEKVLSEEA